MVINWGDFSHVFLVFKVYEFDQPRGLVVRVSDY